MFSYKKNIICFKMQYIKRGEIPLVVGIGRAGSIVGLAKTGSGQNWPDFFGQKI